MKICITAGGDNLQSQVDPRFGRCRYFIIYDDSDNTFEAIANPNIDAGSGAGIQSAQLVVSKNVSRVMTGEVGPKAEKVLQAAKVQVMTGETNNVCVKDFIEKLTINIPVIDKVKDSRHRGSMGDVKNVAAGHGNHGGHGSTKANYCLCPKCGERKPHQRGVPCRSVICHKCGAAMVRE